MGTDLIAELKRRQAGMSQEQFARLLGIRQPLLSRIYSGDRRISPRLARRLRALYPELAFLLAEYLLAEDGAKDIAS